MLLIVGCGDIGLRVARLLAGSWRILALTSSGGRLVALRAAGIVPLRGDLDRPHTIARLAGLADAVLDLAPPAQAGTSDARTMHLLHALARSPRPGRVVYASTTGVYGDRAGAPTDETAPVRPATDRARRRADAEERLRRFGRARGSAVTLLRVPGIYALDRAGGDPRERIARGTPVLIAADDVCTSHIHADDLARACVAALQRGRPQRVVNVADDTALRMGDYFDFVADRFGLARPPRVARAQAAAVLSPTQLSFLAESRRIVNTRMKRELRVVLRYPTVAEGLAGSAPTRSGE